MLVPCRSCSPAESAQILARLLRKKEEEEKAKAKREKQREKNAINAAAIAQEDHGAKAVAQVGAPLAAVAAAAAAAGVDAAALMMQGRKIGPFVHAGTTPNLNYWLYKPLCWVMLGGFPSSRLARSKILGRIHSARACLAAMPHCRWRSCRSSWVWRCTLP